MRKIFKFAIEIDGVDQMLIQDAKKPKVSVGQAKHGKSNYDEKTAGGVDVGNATLQKVKPADTGDSWAWDWLMTAQDPNSGSGGLPADYKKDVIFKELDPRGRTLNAWLWEGVWVISTDDSNYKRGNQSENVSETVELSVDRVKKIV